MKTNDTRHFRKHHVISCFARLKCLFVGHKIVDKICQRCKSEFGMPVYKSPPPPPEKLKINLYKNTMITENIIPKEIRTDLSKIPHIVKQAQGETVFVGMSYYLNCLFALEQAEKLLREVRQNGWTVETMKQVPVTSSTICQPEPPAQKL